MKCADDLIQARFAAERFNRHTANQQDDPWAEEAQFFVEVGTAECQFRWRGAAVSIALGIAARIAVGKRAEIGVLVEIARRKAGSL